MIEEKHVAVALAMAVRHVDPTADVANWIPEQVWDMLRERGLVQPHHGMLCRVEISNAGLTRLRELLR